MPRTSTWAILALAVGLSAAQAADPLEHSLVHGIFQPAAATGAGPILPLAPAQKLERHGGAFRVLGGEGGQPLAFPVFTSAAATEAADLKDLDAGGTPLVAALDLTGAGTSDLIYATPAGNGWQVLTNGARLAKPVQGFVAGHFEPGAATARAAAIPADTRDLKVDQDTLAAVGDFLGTGSEQLAYTRPGSTFIYVVGAHGVTAMKADLKGIEATAPGPRSHWLFPYKASRQGQRTRLAYYRLGADHLLRLVPKGMEFTQEQVPLKGHWQRLNQAVLDWPQAAPAPSH